MTTAIPPRTFPVTSVVAPTSSRQAAPKHCPLCLPDRIYSGGDGRPVAFLFLDMDGVMIYGCDSYPLVERLSATVNELFPKEDFPVDQRRHTNYQWLVAKLRHLNPRSVEQLNDLIEKTEAAGYRARVVLSNSWKNYATLDQHVGQEAFGQTPFGSRICGKTAPRDFDTYTPEVRAGWNFSAGAQKLNLQLQDRADSIEYWLRDHGFNPAETPFVILDNIGSELKRFGSHFLKVQAWGYEEDLTRQALTALGIANPES